MKKRIAVAKKNGILISWSKKSCCVIFIEIVSPKVVAAITKLPVAYKYFLTKLFTHLKLKGLKIERPTSVGQPFKKDEDLLSLCTRVS